MNPIHQIKEKLQKNNVNEPEFLQSSNEILDSISFCYQRKPHLFKDALLERLFEPERQIIFRVPWIDDNNNVHVNRGFRIEFNSALGPYKGGLRFHPSVNLSIMKFLSFEQCFKNALTNLPLGGGKGGSDFDPKNKSDFEIMRFCQSFMNELYRHIGEHTDIPAGDIGVSEKEIGYLFGQYKKLQNTYTGIITGKSTVMNGSFLRKEATGYGLCYFTKEMLLAHHITMEHKTAIISGSGNVAIYTLEKLMECKVKVIAMSDSNGYILDQSGICLSTIKKIKEQQKLRIKEYLSYHPNARYFENAKEIWHVPCDLAFPCATQNEIDLEEAIQLTNQGVIAVAEGANMPCSPAAIQYLLEHNILYAPAKASNAGGVVVSNFEMSQNATHLKWSPKKVDALLNQTMKEIYHLIASTAQQYNLTNNLCIGANIAGFERIANAMLNQGIV